MFRELRKTGFLFVALIAIVTSMFKLNAVVASPSKFLSKTEHNSKSHFNDLSSVSSVLLYESDTEEVDNEEADDEVDHLFVDRSFLTDFHVTPLFNQFQRPLSVWNETPQKSNYPSIYLVYRNFRL